MDKYHQQVLATLDTCVSWREFKIRLDSNQDSVGFPITGKFFEIFCKYYFLAEPTVKDDYLNVWLYDEAPPAVLRKLNIGKKEYGVDLILETRYGEFAVVQCKYRKDETQKLSWTKDKIGNLFGFVRNADQYIIFTNASELDYVSKTRTEQFEFFNVRHLLQIEPPTFEVIRKLLRNLKPLPPKRIKPYPHQVIAVSKVISHFKTNDRGQLILPCGAGKTYTALWIKEKLQAKLTLVLVPSLALLRQIKNVWAKQKKEDYAYICVCSEKDISKSNDETIVHTYEVGGKVTTDPIEIKYFITGEPKNKVIFSTYQSLPAVSKSVKDHSVKIDLVICDEAHKTAGSKQSAFSLVHDNKDLPAEKRLYMTATPRVLSNQLKARMGEDIKYICDMSNPKIYGEEIYRLSFKEAIEKGILVDYKIIAIGVTDKEIETYIKNRKYVNQHESIDEIANNFALKMVMEKFGANHSVTFHSRVKSAFQFTNRHQNLFPTILSDHVNGAQSTSERSLILNEFDAAPSAVLTNARCLVEGIDLPTIDLVYFCDPKNSKIDIVQASGRALRTDHHRNKKIGLIVVPVFHTEKDKLEDAIDSSIFKNLIQVVRALSDQDERLRDEITKLAFQRGIKALSKVYISFTPYSEEKIIQLIGFEDKLKSTLFDQIIDKSAISWDVQYKYLMEFRKYNPHRWPEAREEYPKGTPLGRWCNTQRQLYKVGELTNDRIKLLNQIGFIWGFTVSWDSQFKTLLKYRKENSNKWPKTREEYPSENKLGSWCSKQRRLYRLNKLEKHKVDALNIIGFPWKQRLAWPTHWSTQYKHLLSYRKINPNKWPKPQEEYPKGNRLGSWCSNQRILYKKTLLSSKRINLLNKIGFSWGREYAWNAKYNLLIDYRKEHPNKWPSLQEEYPPGIRLGAWCISQRHLFSQNKLSKHRILLLEKIGFVLETKDKKWMSQHNYLLEYRKKYPDMWPKKLEEFPKGNTLGNWCDKQRFLKKKNKLSESRIRLLNKIHFPWKVEMTWDDIYKLLLKYRVLHPNKWPNSREEYPKGFKLGLWCYRQRKNFKLGILEKTRIEKLNQINFPF